MARTEIRGGQIQDESITEADIKDGSIKAAELAPEAITGQTLHSGTVDDVNDMMLIYDASTTALRKIPVGDLAGGGGGGTPTMIEDTDQDTRVEVESTADDDTIRFRTAGSERMVISSTGKVTMENDLQVNGSIVTTNDISFQDNNGTYPTNTAGFFWDLNTDEARIYAEQPASDQISFYFKLSDNSNQSNDRYVFWHHDYRGISYHRYPLTMYGENCYIHSPPSATSGVPDVANAKLTIPNGTSSGTTTTHKGRLFLDGDNTDDLYIRFQNNTEDAYIFQDQSNSNAFKIESANDIAFNTNGPNERMRINSAGDVTISNALIVSEIDASGDLTLDANGGQIYMKDNGITYLTFNVDGTTDSIDAVGHLKLNASADVYINAQQGDIFFQDNGTTRMRIEDTTGDISIGMGDTGPVYRLDVHDNTSGFVMNIENDYTSAGADLLRMQVSILNPSSSSALIYIYDSSNTGIYAVQGNGSGGSTVTTSFTAGHDTVIQQSTDVVPGMIVESTGESWYKPTLATFETALPKVRLSDTNGSKKVFGVVAGFPEAEGDEEGWQHNGYTMRPAFPKYGQIAGIDSTEWNIGTMSIGEGCIWITNINGEIQNGDLIESSVILGHGRLQDDDIMRSKTVAKCTEDIDWNSVTETIDHEGVTYKKFLASCTFHCG